MSQTTNRLIKEMAATRNQQIDRETASDKEKYPKIVKVATIGGKPIRHALRELARLWRQIEQHRQTLVDAGYEPPQSKEFLCHCDGDEPESGEAIGGVRSLAREYKVWHKEQEQIEKQQRRRQTLIAALAQRAMIDTISMAPRDLSARLKKFATELEGV